MAVREQWRRNVCGCTTGRIRRIACICNTTRVICRTVPLWYKDHKLITLRNGVDWMHKDHHQRGLTLILYILWIYYQWAYTPVEYIHTVYRVCVLLCAICSVFSGRLITPKVFQYWLYFTTFLSDCIRHRRFTCVCHFRNKSQCCHWGTKSAVLLYRQRNQSIHMTDGMHDSDVTFS